MAKKKEKKTAPADTPSEADVVVKKKSKPGRPKKAAIKVKAKLVKAETRELQTAYGQTKQAFRTAWQTGVDAANNVQKYLELMVDQLFKLEKAKTLRQAVEIIRSENEDLPGFSRTSLYQALPDNLKEDRGPRGPHKEKPPKEAPPEPTTPENGEKVAKQAEVISKELDKDRSPINITEEVIQSRVKQEVENETRKLKTALVEKDRAVAKAKHDATEADRARKEAENKVEELSKKVKAAGESEAVELEIVKEEKEVIQVEVEMVIDDGRGGKVNIYKQMLDLMMKKTPKFYLDVNAKTGKAFKVYT